MEKYTNHFYSQQERATKAATEAVLNEVFDRVPEIRSVVDVGCGCGIWLAAVLDRGVEKVLGLDGPWLNQETLAFPSKHFRSVDLNGDFGVSEKYDLAISLEVAEHLPAESAESFVGQLTGLSDRILFSAAIPGQGGTHHYNEQWQSYWTKLFAECGFKAYDFIRPTIWSDATIPFYYRQNILFFSREELGGVEGVVHPLPEDLVHPELFEKRLCPGIKASLKFLVKAVTRRLKS